MSLENALLVIAVGILCGFINTLAGSGSLISLPILMFIGLPPHVANGTNRIGILFQNIVSTRSFYKQGVLDVANGWKVAIPSVLGSVAGAMIVLELNERAVEITVGVIMFIMLFPMFISPRKWLYGTDMTNVSRNPFIVFVIFFIIGVYGGFIQAGVGIFLLSALVLNQGYNLVRANALKVFINLIFTPFALMIFIWQGQVDIVAGLVLAVGNSTGAWIASRWAVSWGPVFVRYILLIVIVLAGGKLLFFP